jgi:hypothetical protein
MLLLMRLLFAAAAAAAAQAAAASSFISTATLLIQPHLFSATQFVLTHWLACSLLLHSDWFILVWLSAAAAPGCFSRCC